MWRPRGAVREPSRVAVLLVVAVRVGPIVVQPAGASEPEVFGGGPYGWAEDLDIAGEDMLDVVQGWVKPPQVHLPEHGGSVELRVTLVLRTPLQPDESMSVLYRAPDDSENEYIDPLLDVPLEEIESPVPTIAEAATGGAPGELPGPRSQVLQGRREVQQWAAREGMYTAAYLMVSNMMGEVRYYSAAPLEGVGLTLDYVVTGARVDMQPPQLLAITMPNVVHVGLPGRSELPVESAADSPQPGGNATVVLVEDESGLAPLAPPSVVTGSHLVVKAAGAPGLQSFTLHFDQANEISTKSLPTWWLRKLRQEHPTARVYSVNISLPGIAWGGQWDLHSIVLVDGGGNRVALDHNDLLEWKSQRGFRVENHLGNLTYYGEDLFDYGIEADYGSDFYADDDYADDGYAQ